MSAFRQDAMRQQRLVAAGERVSPPGKGGLDIEPSEAVIGPRYRCAVDGDVDRHDTDPGDGPAADFEIAANRRLGRAADQTWAVDVQPEVGIAGSPRGARTPRRAGDDRDLGVVDFAVFAPYPQRDQMLY